MTSKKVFSKLSLFNNSIFTMKTDHIMCRLLFNTGVQYSELAKSTEL